MRKGRNELGPKFKLEFKHPTLSLLVLLVGPARKHKITIPRYKNRRGRFEEVPASGKDNGGFPVTTEGHTLQALGAHSEFANNICIVHFLLLSLDIEWPLSM